MPGKQSVRPESVDGRDIPGTAEFDDWIVPVIQKVSPPPVFRPSGAGVPTRVPTCTGMEAWATQSFREPGKKSLGRRQPYYLIFHTPRVIEEAGADDRVTGAGAHAHRRAWPARSERSGWLRALPVQRIVE